jgi:K(+)-stimulated pyrophosphate-energized sodium pump
MMITEFPWAPPLMGLLGLLVAWRVRTVIIRQPGGEGSVQALAAAIRSGAMVFLREEYTLLAAFAGVVALGLFIGLGRETALAFVLGAASSAAAGCIGIDAATRANAGTAVAAQRHGLPAALRSAFLGGSVMGLAVAALGLLGLGLLYLFFSGDPASLRALNGFGMGASTVALFARVGGGIFTKAADIGADMVGKVEAAIPEDDPRNPGVITDNVGDNVGDIAGMGADIFESYVSALIAAIAIASTLTVLEADGLGGRPALLALPLVLASGGLLISIAAIGVVNLFSTRKPEVALGMGIGIGALLFIVVAWVLIDLAAASHRLWFAVVIGTSGSAVIGVAIAYYTEGPPVMRVAAAGTAGPATVIITGLALGMSSIAIPLLTLGFVIIAASQLAGLYGVALAAVGMLATVGIVMAVDAYGPIADNAGGIAQMAKLGDETRRITDLLDTVGNTTAAIGKGFAISSAALAALALLSAYTQAVLLEIPGFHLMILEPMVLVGLIIGGLLPFMFSAMTMTAVGEAAAEIIEEIRRQFREVPGLLEGTAEPDSGRCTAIASRAALRRMIAPGFMALAAPLAVGFGLGPYALGGMLSGALLTGVMLALLMANAGAAWDNAKKYIERGNLGGKGSAVHHASIVGDTVGDPFKDTAGPSLNILIKVMAITGLLIAPFLR